MKLDTQILLNHFLNVTKCDSYGFCCCGSFFVCFVDFAEKLLDHKECMNLDDGCE